MWKFCVLCLSSAAGVAVGILMPASAHSESWTSYRDNIYGCRMDYPNSVFTQDALDVAERTLRFSGPNAQTYFRIMGIDNTERLSTTSIKAKYLNADIPGDITYERTKGSFLVLSGYRGENIFYTRVAMSPGHKTICIMEITYPREAKRAFDNIVTRMSQSFIASE